MECYFIHFGNGISLFKTRKRTRPSILIQEYSPKNVPFVGFRLFSSSYARCVGKNDATTSLPFEVKQSNV